MYTLAISGSLERRAPQIAFGTMNTLSNREIIVFAITVFRFWEIAVRFDAHFFVPAPE
jgi:hypothetical protein